MRKAYGAGLYAMCGPGFGPDAYIALSTARIAVMGPEAAVNAVYFNKIAEIADEDERAAFVEDLGGSLPVEDLAGSAVEGGLDGQEVLQGPAGQVRALRKGWRSRPLVFSLVPRCHGECGSAK